jgi:peptidyl-prolyl cis-trans isomerase SurA
MRRSILLPALCLALLAGCSKTPPKDVAAMVNNRTITNADLDKQYLIQFPNSGENVSDDQRNMQKLELLRSMVDSEIMLQRAEKLGLMAVDADVETKLNEMRAPYTTDEFQKQLNARKMTLEDLKAQLRKDLSVQKLFNKEITAHINISDKDVADFYNANKAGFNLAEPQVHLARILVSAVPDPAVRNLKNDKAQNEDQAKKKIQMLEARLKGNEDFAMLAQNYSEDANTLANGGDLGFISESALEKANPELRKLVLSLKPGQVSPVIRTTEGFQILKVISKEPAGQRELNDPRVQQTIRETLLNRKDQLYKAAYYEAARNEARVTNYFAQQVVEMMEKKTP